MCNGTPFIVEKISPQEGFEPGIARSVGQCLTPRVTWAPNNKIINYLGVCPEKITKKRTH